MNGALVLRTEVDRLVPTDTYAGATSVARSLAAERALDTVLADSFPASDPPSWTLGLAEARPSGQPDLDSHREATALPLWLQRVASFVGLMLVVFAIPFFVLGLPLALAWRAVLSTTKWRAA